MDQSAAEESFRSSLVNLLKTLLEAQGEKVESLQQENTSEGR